MLYIKKCRLGELLWMYNLLYRFLKIRCEDLFNLLEYRRFLIFSNVALNILKIKR